MRSYHHYVGATRPHNKILSLANFPDYFQTSKDFDDFISEWINFDDPIAIVKV